MGGLAKRLSACLLADPKAMAQEFPQPVGPLGPTNSRFPIEDGLTDTSLE